MIWKLLTLFECRSDAANSRGTVRTTQSPNEENSRISYYRTRERTRNKFRGLIFRVLIGKKIREVLIFVAMAAW